MSATTEELETPVVVVIAYGDPQHLLRCLTTLGNEFDVLVVDNGRDDRVERLCSERTVRYLRPERNLGFAGGVNRALNEIRPGRDVLLLNPDAALKAFDLHELQGALHAPNKHLAAVAPVLKRPDGSTEQTSWPVPSPSTAWAGVIGLSSRVTPRRRFLNGAVLLLNGRALQEVGRFDERYFLYTEETDWQVRAQAVGWGIAPCPAATAEHVGGATSSDSQLRERFFHGSAELFARKWYGTAGWWLFRGGSLAAALRRLVLARTREARLRHWFVVRLYLRGPARSLPRVALDSARGAS